MKTAVNARILLTALFAVTLWSCGSNVDFVRTDLTEYPALDSKAPVEVHQGEVVRPHVVIGVVTARQDMQATTGSLSSYDEAIRRLKVKAREVGGQALAELRPIYSDESRVRAQVELTAKVIRYLEKTGSVSAQ